MCKNNSYCDISQLVKKFALENNISEQEMINLLKNGLMKKKNKIHKVKGKCRKSKIPTFPFNF